MKRALLLALTLTAPLAQASASSDSKPDCDAIKTKAATNGVHASSDPNMDGLKDAARLYAVSPSIAVCLYPSVSVRNLPVGEYESADDPSPPAITLTGRAEYSWGVYKFQQAVISVPAGLSVTTSTLPSGQVVIEAATSDGYP
ncbi:hypothetical protein ACRCPT_07085 [Pseudomonas aeruginosa]|uniref:hypothetical protein n=1 Tax=Ectopseudomonas guguanensis TaxID=1198456 RepID=UPI002865E8C7|nr:hypothetical protein [Pseudomonas guguanensis]MDR8015630.1 hypothetical protein [Pseudomonas guguanensis]